MACGVSSGAVARGIPAQWLLKDAVAGVTLAAYGIPVSLAYASLAGLPPQYGIYCYLVGGLFYALFGSSRQLAIGPTSAISMLVGVTVAGMADGDPARWASIAALTALVMAAMCVLAWLLRLSSLVNFISETILLGFKAGRGAHHRHDAAAQAVRRQGGRGALLSNASPFSAASSPIPISRCSHSVSPHSLCCCWEKNSCRPPVALLVVVASIFVLSVTPLIGLGIQRCWRIAAGACPISGCRGCACATWTA
jgi:MFS superfamily sulfate permease-like transporter